MERVVGEDGLSVSTERAVFEDGVRQEARQGYLRMYGAITLLVVGCAVGSFWLERVSGRIGGGDSFGWNGSCSCLHRCGRPAVDDC